MNLATDYRTPTRVLDDTRCRETDRIAALRPTSARSYHQNDSRYAARSTRSILAIALLAFILPTLLRAQAEPILVTLSVLPPYAPDLTIWESNPDKVLITLQNRSNESHDVRLSGFAESLDGRVRIVTKDAFPRNRVTVPPLGTRTLNLRDLQLFSANAVDFFGAEKETVARTKMLPEGAYRICVRALEFTSLQPLSPQEPSGCASFRIRLVEEPRPLMPRCGTVPIATNPQRLLFQWSVPAGAPANTLYQFEMTEVPRGRDPNEALASKTAPILFTRQVNTPLLVYSAAEPALRAGQTYAWRVQAIDPTRGVPFRNDGYSAVCYFTWGEQVPLIGRGEDFFFDPDRKGGDRDDDDDDGRLPFFSGDGIRMGDIRYLDDLIVVDRDALAERIKDFINPPDRPDTLVAAGFEIVVEAWDSPSKSDDASRPSGIGRIRFDCEAGPTIFIPLPGWTPDLTLGRFDFEVVGEVEEPVEELSESEARMIHPEMVAGDRVGLYLPLRSGGEGASGGDGTGTIRTVKDLAVGSDIRSEFLIDKANLLDRFAAQGPSGIRVAFRDVTWDGPSKPRVVLTDGVATYPSAVPIPTPPAELDLENGFRVEIDTMTIETSEARFEGRLLLPPTIISTDTCTFATLPIPETTITPYCAFYHETTDPFGPWAIGETGLIVEGEGYTMDFSSTQTPPEAAPNGAWEGVLLDVGDTDPSLKSGIVSNRGYVHARYDFENGTIVGDGFAGILEVSGAYEFYTLDPYRYRVSMKSGALELSKSAIDSGEFKEGRILLPIAAINDGGSGEVRVEYTKLFVQSDMDLAGTGWFDSDLVWGNLVNGMQSHYELSAGVDTGTFWLGSHWQEKAWQPVDDTLYKTPFYTFPGPAAINLAETQKMGGFHFFGRSGRDFHVGTPQVPSSPPTGLTFPGSIVGNFWMHVGYNGVSSEVTLRPNETDPGVVELGPIWADYYRGDSVPFKIIFADLGGGAVMPPTTHYDPEWQDRKMMVFRFVESAVWSSDLSGVAELPGPIGMPVPFRDMMFTSTADNAGGEVTFTGGDTLAHWGLEMAQKDSGSRAGILSAKLGAIFLTAAGFAERVHFDEPFWLTWGEMKASGDFGQLFFDYNNVGQRFDGFGYSTEFVALSPFAESVDSGYIQTYGSLSIPFFGAKMMSISDYRSSVIDTPYSGRFVRVLADPHLGAGASDLDWERSWASGLADMEWDIGYDTVEQNGFIGVGTVDLDPVDGMLQAVIRVTSTSSCFRMIENVAAGFDLGPIVNMGAISEIWGCGCIENGTLRQIALGGYFSTSAGALVVARTGTSMVMQLGITPDRLTMFANGQAFMNLGGNDIDVFGLTHFIVDRDAGYAEGYFKGTASVGSAVGIPIVAGATSGISGFGEFDWHAGLDYQSIQGRVGVAMYGLAGGLGVEVGGGTSMETGLFLGINAPKDKAWVMNGINGRFGLNKGALPNRLTGFYAYLGIKQSLSLFIVSGGYETYAGIGTFAPTADVPTGGMFGNFGIYIWGKILGGLVSASAWGNLQLGVAVPPSFQGTVGLEACVLWVACGSVDITVGFNKEDGFYLY